MTIYILKVFFILYQFYYNNINKKINIRNINIIPILINVS